MKRKKRKIKDTVPLISEYEGYHLEDIVYAKITTGEIRYGPISAFYPKDNLGPAFGFIDWADGKYRVALIEWIVEKPTRTQKKKAERKMR